MSKYLSLCVIALIPACTLNVTEGEGGFGGSWDVGLGGAGEGASSSDGGSTPASGGGGSAPQATGGGDAGGGGSASVGCIPAIPNVDEGFTIDSCDNLNITPVAQGGPASKCEDDEGGFTLNPPGYDLCKHGFTNFSEGAAASIIGCLEGIPANPAYSCDLEVAINCASETLGNLCANAFADSLCEDLSDSCVAAEDTTINVANCKASAIRAINDGDGVTALYGCMADAAEGDGTCQQNLEGCVEALLSFSVSQAG